MSIQSNVIKALNAASTYGDAIAALRVDLAGAERDEVRTTLLPLIAKHYKVEVVEGKLSAESDKYEAAKKALQRMVAAICEGQSSAKKEVDLVAAAVRAFGKLSAAQRKKFMAAI
jgi:argonaute-like protein implicated in RNA metabolism and viral defense